ncbi:hypothetical protein [Rhodococcus sp. 1168]|uniref:hypothetical protein n=1 Tax=Rhodococcus sp. 1168 TaxID=2018041 RepID=UPI0015935B50|nr:hypothetical protein [Rhodococcus sp. 1168]
MALTTTGLLDADYYERGIAARKQSHRILGGIISALDEVEEQADRLLAELLEFIDSDL